MVVVVVVGKVEIIIIIWKKKTDLPLDPRAAASA